MRLNVGPSWFIVLIAFIIFTVGAAFAADTGPVSFHNSALIILTGLAVYMLSILAGGWVQGPAA